MSKDQKKYEEDLASLREVVDLVIMAQKHVGGQEGVLKALSEIGKLLHDISWNQANPDCIRNKHGYRNRHEKGNNEKNTTGAKLDFETLGHLEDLVKDPNKQLMLIENLDLVRSSLISLKQKAEFILDSASHNANDYDKSEVGFLRTIAAYHHDLKCLHTLIQLTETVETPLYKNLDLNSKIDRYWLGYFFARIGETAKEISEFVKPENKNVADENNATRFLLTKLGHYRQEVKDHPHIVYDMDNFKLLQMKHQFEIAAPILKTFLSKLYSLLETFSDTKNLITYYPQFNMHPVKADKYSKDGDIDPKKGFAYSVLELTFLGEGLQSESIKSINKMIESFDCGIKNLRAKLISLEVSMQNERFLLAQYKTELDEAESNKTLLMVSNNDLQPSAPQPEFSNQIKTFAGVLKRLLYNNVINDQLIKNLELNQDKLQDQFITLLTKEKKGETELKGNALKSKVSALVQIFSTAFSTLSADNKECTILYFLAAILDNQSTDINSKINELRSKIQSIEHRIEINKQDLDKYEEIQKVEGQYIQEHIKRPLSSEDKTIQGQNVTANEVDKKIKFITKIKHELDTLISIEKTNSYEKIEYARKLCVGFIGKYNADLLKEEGVLEYINQSGLFLSSIGISITTRNKIIMHGTTSSDSEILVTQTSKSHLLPWQQSYDALHTIMLKDNSCQNIILGSFSSVPPWNKGQERVEEEMLTTLLLMGAYFRLMQYEKVIEEFLQERVQSYIQSPNPSPLLKTSLLSSYAYALIPHADQGKIKVALQTPITYIEQLNIQSLEIGGYFAKIVTDLKASLLLYDHSSCYMDLGPSSNVHNKLKLADNLIENWRLDEAWIIIEPIYKELENSPTSFSELSVPRWQISVDCYRSVSMYQRCKHEWQNALNSLTIAEEILTKYSTEVIERFGEVITQKKALISSLKSACYVNLGKEAYHIDHNSAVSPFLNAVEEVKQAFAGTLKDNLLEAANVYRNLAIAKVYLGKIRSNSTDLKYAEKLAEKVQEFISKLQSPDDEISICELWISLTDVYALISEETLNKKTVFCLAQAEKNKYWKLTAENFSLPLTREVIIGVPNDFVVKELTWGEFYNTAFGEDVALLELSGLNASDIINDAS